MHRGGVCRDGSTHNRVVYRGGVRRDGGTHNGVVYRGGSQVRILMTLFF